MTTTARAPQTMLARIGGRDSVVVVVDRLHACLDADPRLRQFFDYMSRPTIKQRTVDLLENMLSGGADTACRERDLEDTHASLRITQAHFDIVAGYVLMVLSSLEVPADIIYTVAKKLTAVEQKIVSPPASPE